MEKRMNYKPSNTDITLKSNDLLGLRAGKDVYVVINGKTYILDCIVELKDWVELYADKFKKGIIDPERSKGCVEGYDNNDYMNFFNDILGGKKNGY